ncbi:uncharacterized protein LOC116619461 [Nematostella vectensis]|uniref:uncharacterized protein LOC116619461 n=1 Tax=Nematostella vectensis TaxID=45351 RepID=UPI00207780E3|nr:uncharacterized protein LOC116619461 [Nematostella vectensis]XP_048585371.1 uncharacterized protein LOC116619461 [Nematostella vectensis]
MSAMFIDPFDRLLNNISHDLDDANLRSLIYICSHYIPGCKRDEIKHGLQVFRLLKERDVIAGNREKIGNLLAIVYEIKPRRKDIIQKVKDFIEFDLGLVIAGDLESSGEHTPILFRGENDGSFLRCRSPAVTPRCCAIECCCCSCNCRPSTVPASVCLVFSALFALLSVLAAIAWYGDLKVVTDAVKKGDWGSLGKYIIGLLALISVVFFVLAIYVCVRNRRQRQYAAMLDSVSHGSHDSRPSSGMTRQSSIASSLSNISPSRHDKRIRRYSSSTAASSVPNNRPPLDDQAFTIQSLPKGRVVADGVQYDDHSDVGSELSFDQISGASGVPSEDLPVPQSSRDQEFMFRGFYINYPAVHKQSNVIDLH